MQNISEGKLRILFIANARRKGGLSGSDSIYLNFAKHWPAEITIWDMVNIDFKPFALCYVYRIFVSIMVALKWRKKFDVIYSCSDFLMDSVPAWILKLRNKAKWIAGFYLFAPKENKPYYYSQKIAYKLIKKWADIVFITNDSMADAFKGKRHVSINGGIEWQKIKDAAVDRPKQYDCVFIGRIHPTKGIKDLIDIWCKVLDEKPEAKLAIIGGGDLGVGYLHKLMAKDMRLGTKSVIIYNTMGEERYSVLNDSRIVLYPAKTHFSMSPVEAMATGCPMVAFNSDAMEAVNPRGTTCVKSNLMFASRIMVFLSDSQTYNLYSERASRWAKLWDWQLVCEDIWKEIKDEL